MQYIEQTPDDLRLIIGDKVISSDNFNVVSKHHIKHKGYSIVFGILTESHFVTFKRNETEFSEVCACNDVKVTGTEQVKITNQTAKLQRDYLDLSYSFSHEAMNMSTGTKRLSLLQDKRSRTDVHYLTHTFPTSKQGEFPAVTEVYISVSEVITIESVHTYPNCDVMVFTTSVIQTQSNYQK
jgi:hypothetical protein